MISASKWQKAAVNVIGIPICLCSIGYCLYLFTPALVMYTIRGDFSSLYDALLNLSLFIVLSIMICVSMYSMYIGITTQCRWKQIKMYLFNLFMALFTASIVYVRNEQLSQPEYIDEGFAGIELLLIVFMLMSWTLLKRIRHSD